MRRYVSAELLRAKGTALAWLPWLAAPLVLLTYNFSRLASPALDATGILMWQAMYVTGMFAPFVSIFAASAEGREKKARSGGTLWRPVDERRVRLARCLVVLASVGVFHLLNFGGAYLMSVITHRAHGGVILLLGLYCFVGSVGVVGLAAACARLTSLIATLVVFAVWQLVSIAPGIVEGSSWWAWPMAWPVRLVLPVMGVHQNATPLAPDSPLRAEGPWIALALCLLLAMWGVAAAVLTPAIRWRRPTGRRQANSVRSGTPWSPANARRSTGSLWGALRAFARPLFTPALVSCMGLSTALLLVTAATYPASYVHGLYTFFILPVGSGVLAVIAWHALADAWPMTCMESTRSAPAVLLWLGGCVIAMGAAAGTAGILAGGTVSDELRRFLLSCVVGSVLVLFSLLVVLRSGASAAIAVTVILTIISVTLGGDVLAQTSLWLVALPSWPETADTPGRLVIALVAGVGGGLLLAAAAHRRLTRGVLT